jgi:hypothetical protein
VSLARAASEIALFTDTAPALTSAAEGLRRELDEPLSVEERANVLSNLGEVLGELHDPGAIEVLSECLALSRTVGDDGGVGAALASLAEHELRRGDTSSAARHQLEALHLAAEMAIPVLIANSFILGARLAEPVGLGETALRLHAAADVMLAEAGFGLVPSDQALSGAMRERVRLQLGDERYDESTSSGRQLELHAAIELAEDVFATTIGT